jgi:DNA-binding transcriptional ArsR family regulator
MERNGAGLLRHPPKRCGLRHPLRRARFTAMTATNKLAIVAACAGDPARASMLNMLADGRAFTAGELSAIARVTPQTASGHLARMVDAGLLAVASQGRHRYYQLASPQVALMLESMMVVAEPARRVGRAGPADESLRLARTCYDHLAGRLAVGIADALIDAGHLSLTHDAGEVTASGRVLFENLGIDLAGKSNRPFCRPCLDWSERRYHLAGTLGSRLMHHCLEAGWVRRKAGSRAVEMTPLGVRKFRDVFGLRLDR